MIIEPYWIEVDEVITLNQAAVAATGENHFVINRETLESAVNNPRDLFHYDRQRDVVVLACRLVVALCRAHAFEQGNKRTAWAAGIMFLQAHGYDIHLPNKRANEFFAERLTEVITREITEAHFLSLVESFIVPL